MDLKNIKNIGEARAKAFEEKGIFSTEDLLNYFPYKYYDFSKTENFEDDGRAKLIKATVTENAKVVKTRANFSFTSAKMTDGNGHSFTAIWYNQPYIKQNLFLGKEIYLYGKNSPTKKNTFVVILSKNPENLEGVSFLPVYHQVSKIGQKIIHDSINQVLKTQEISSFVPNELLYKYNLLKIEEAFDFIHNPTSLEIVQSAINRIQIENLIPLIAINEYKKTVSKQIKNHKYNQLSTIGDFEKLLPFSLTFDQRQAIFEIDKDLNSKFSMNRLLQGDVGSGKTLVSFYGVYLSLLNGLQSAILAPTEILAKQHYDLLVKLFSKYNNSIVFLSGSTKPFEKCVILEKIASGEALIVVGTHSIFAGNIQFKNLSYIVIDEQHRFGVTERAKLKEKGQTPDILVMSATPIPRSMALVLYGDLEITQIKNRPKPSLIQTNLVPLFKQNDMWNYLKKQTENGSKLFVVCSKIDEENDSDSEIKKSAKNVYEYIKSIFNENEIGLIHGKLKKETQNEIILKFRNGSLKVLVSTTIIEVGVDIPEADIMVICSPERFGLATLHQLRGRVGRNGKQAYCFCLTDTANENSMERIKFFKEHNNGFEIAEFDQKMRGSGSIIGTNQHGEDNGLFSNFSIENYSLAKEILEIIKGNSLQYAKVLSKGNELYNQKINGKIILN